MKFIGSAATVGKKCQYLVERFYLEKI